MRNILVYLGGCFTFSLGATFFIASHFGTDPLDVFCLGIQNQTGMLIGTTQCLFAIVCLIIFCIIEGKRPPLSTFITFFLCGYLIDAMRLIQIGDHRLTFLVLGSLLCLEGSALIIVSGIGIRAMDLVSFALERKTNIPFWLYKSCFESLLLVVGYYYGGPVGIGTITFLVVVGFLVQPAVSINRMVLKQLAI